MKDTPEMSDEEFRAWVIKKITRSWSAWKLAEFRGWQHLPLRTWTRLWISVVYAPWFLYRGILGWAYDRFTPIDRQISDLEARLPTMERSPLYDIFTGELTCAADLIRAQIATLRAREVGDGE